MLLAALHGFLLALALILPIGMQNGFIIGQGALHKRWFGALPAVITAALCDTLLVSLAVIGVSSAALHITWLRYAFGALGILFLLYIGSITWRDSSKIEQLETATAWSPKRQIKFAASVSLLNPHALIDTLAVIGGSALMYTSWPDKFAFGIACVAVSWIWFFVLVILGHVTGRVAVKKSSLGLINRISAIMMWGSAIYLSYIIYTFK